jgi:hypothetical protein
VLFTVQYQSFTKNSYYETLNNRGKANAGQALSKTKARCPMEKGIML